MAENTIESIWLTKDAHTKLVEELDHLKEVGRAEVTARIAQAREEGDLKENGGYHAAREEQGQQEARIRQLEDILRRAEVGELPEDPDEVGAGSKVTIAFDGDLDDTETFLLGSREVIGLDDDIDFAVYSPQSPLGAAIIGRKKGDTVSYPTPAGKEIAVKIVAVEPFDG